VPGADTTSEPGGAAIAFTIASPVAVLSPAALVSVQWTVTSPGCAGARNVADAPESWTNAPPMTCQRYDAPLIVAIEAV